MGFCRFRSYFFVRSQFLWREKKKKKTDATMSLELANEVGAVVALLTEMMSAAQQGAASVAFETQWRLRSGFAPLLASLAVDVCVTMPTKFPLFFLFLIYFCCCFSGINNDVRQMALLLLKRIGASSINSLSFFHELTFSFLFFSLFQVAENWNQVSQADKAHVRAVVPQALNDSVTKLQTATAMLIANIAQHDWPTEWPSFFDQLLPCLRHPDDALLRRGAIRTVHMFASGDFVDARHLPYVVDLLVPELLSILQSDDVAAFDATSRARALAVFRSILAWVAFEKQHTLATFANAVPIVMQLCLSLLAQATAERVVSDPAGGYHFEIEAVGLLSDLMARFKSHLEPVMPQCAGTIVALLAASLEPYLALASRAGGSHQTDADGNEIGLEALALFALECVAALCNSKKSARHLEPQIDALCRCVVGYACMTYDDIELWQSDANEFIDGEEDVFRWSLRLCAIRMSESIVNRFAVAGLNSLLASASQWCARDDWRARESAELMVGNVAGELAGANRALRDESGATMVQFNAIEFVENVLVPDVGESQPPFLQARALWCAAQFTSDMPITLVAPFLQYCAQSLGDGETAEPVLVMATKAIHKFCVPLGNSRRHEAAVVQSLMPTIISGLAARFVDATENQLVQLVDALTVAQRVDVAATAQLAPQVLPYVLAVWSKNTNDSLMDDALQDCVRSFTSIPACVALVGAALERPTATLLRRELAENVDVLGLRNSLLIMIGAVVDGHDAAAGGPILSTPSFLIDTALPLVADIALTTADHEPLQNSCIALSAFARRFTPPADGGGGQVAELLLRCAAHLLSPSLEDAATFHVGSLVSALLGGAMRALVQPHLSDILSTTYARLGVARTDVMIVELLVVFVRLFRLDADAVSQWLAAMPPDGRAPIADGEPSASGLHYVLGLWCKHHPTLVGAFVTKLSAATLIQIAATPLGDIAVPGRLIVEERRAGPRRSSRQAALAGKKVAAAERYTSVPLRAKVVELLASNYRDALLMDLTAGVPDAVADEFEGDGDDETDEEVDLLDEGGFGDDDDEFGDEDDDPNAHFYRLLSQFDSEDDEQDGDREEVDEPDIVHDPLYPVKFNVLLEQYFGATARDAPHVLQQASDEGLLNAQQRQDIESAVKAFQQS